MYASGLLCLWFNLSSHTKQIGHWIKNGIILAVPTFISLAAIYKFFLSKGTNPASISPGFHLSLKALGFPLASPLLSGFSIDELVHGLIYHQDTPFFGPGTSLIILLLLAVLSIGLFVVIIRWVPNPKYRLALSAFYGVSVLFFLSVFLRQLSISYEGRHFRIVGLLFIPGTIYLFMQAKPIFKYILTVLWIGIAFTSVKYFVKGYYFNTHIGAHGPSGFSQQFVDQPALNYLQTLDKSQPNNALFAFISNDLGLDIVNHRIVTMDPFEEIDTATYIENNEYDGHSGPLFILLPAGFVKNGNVDAFRKCFPDYHDFSIKKISKDYILLSAP